MSADLAEGDGVQTVTRRWCLRAGALRELGNFWNGVRHAAGRFLTGPDHAEWIYNRLDFDAYEGVRAYGTHAKVEGFAHRHTHLEDSACACEWVRSSG